MKKLLNLVFIAILGVCNLYAQGVDLKREGTTVSSGTDSVCWEGKYEQAEIGRASCRERV